MKKILLLLFISQLSFCFADKSPRATSANSKDFAYSKDVCPNKFYTEFDYLLMNFFEDGLEYALIIDGKNNNSQRDQKFNSGVRMTLGLPFSKCRPNDPKIEFSWTYIKMKRSSDTVTMNTIHNLFLPPQFLTSSRASESLSGNFNTIDLNFLKPHHVSKYYISTPELGIRGALIYQDLKVIYTIVNTLNTVSGKNNYWGIGFLAGYKANFIISSHYSIYAKSAFSLLYGRTKVAQASDIPITLLSQYNLKEKIYSVMPNTEMAIGLSFDKPFNHNKKKLSIKVGYEFHHFWDQNNFRRFMDSDPVSSKRVARNNLKFNGLNFSLSLHI